MEEREDFERELKRVLARARPYLTRGEIHTLVDTALDGLEQEVVKTADQALRSDPN